MKERKVNTKHGIGTFDRVLGHKIGLKPAILMGQLQFWLARRGVGVMNEGHKWVHLTYQAWADQVVTTERDIRRIVGKLRALGLIETCQIGGHNRALFYRICEDNLADLTGQKRADEAATEDGSCGQNGRFYTKNTQRLPKKKKINKKESLEFLESSQADLPDGKALKAPLRRRRERYADLNDQSAASCKAKVHGTGSAEGLRRENPAQKFNRGQQEEIPADGKATVLAPKYYKTRRGQTVSITDWNIWKESYGVKDDAELENLLA